MDDNTKKVNIDLNSAGDFSARVNFLIDAGIDAEAKKSPVRHYLGCSVLGNPCERAVQYDALATVYSVDACASTFPARVRRIFERGHDAEDRAAAWLRGAGFVMDTLDPKNSGQFEVSFMDGRVLGHADGLILHFLGDGPAPFALPALWECKCLGAKYWRHAAREGVKTSHPTYYAQMQLYMYGLRLQRGVISMLNADTCELHHEIVDFDRAAFDALMCRAKRILAACDAGEEIPRRSTSETCIACRMCRHASICWARQC